MTKFQVQGFREFSRQAESAGKEVKTGLRKKLRELGKGIVDNARARAARVGGSAPKAARTLRVNASASRVTITGGGSRAPFYDGNEWGSKQYSQFPAYKGNNWGGWDTTGGYMVYPAIKDEGKTAADEIGKMIDEAWGT